MITRKKKSQTRTFFLITSLLLSGVNGEALASKKMEIVDEKQSLTSKRENIYLQLQINDNFNEDEKFGRTLLKNILWNGNYSDDNKKISFTDLELKMTYVMTFHKMLRDWSNGLTLINIKVGGVSDEDGSLKVTYNLDNFAIKKENVVTGIIFLTATPLENITKPRSISFTKDNKKEDSSESKKLDKKPTPEPEVFKIPTKTSSVSNINTKTPTQTEENSAKLSEPMENLFLKTPTTEGTTTSKENIEKPEKKNTKVETATSKENTTIEPKKDEGIGERVKKERRKTEVPVLKTDVQTQLQNTLKNKTDNKTDDTKKKKSDKKFGIYDIASDTFK